MTMTMTVLGAAPETCVVKDGQALGKIYLPPECGRATRFAADELRSHVKAMTGADLELAWRDAGPRDSGFVFKIRPEKEWKGKESSQAFTIKQESKPHPLVTIVGDTDLAVLYGVYQYLADLGVEWLTPGEIGTNIPRMSDIPVIPGERHVEPSFKSRVLALSSTAGNHFGGVRDRAKAVYEYELYLLRNRTQFSRNIAGVDFAFNKSVTGSSHAVKPMTGLTREKVKEGLMDNEPERFALVTGGDFVQKRRYKGGQVCFTNEKNIQTAIDNCVKHFEKLADDEKRETDLDEDATVPMGLSDCFGMCECDQCAKIAGAGPYKNDRLVWHFWNRVAKGLAERMPGKMMAVHSPYMDLSQPPEDVTIEPNVMVITPLVHSWEKRSGDGSDYVLPERFKREITRTRDAGAVLGCYVYLNFPWSPTPLTVLDSAKAFADLGYKHYHLEAMQRTEYTWPIVWALAQFTWDSSKSPREYLKEFCVDCYGSAYGEKIYWIFEAMTREALGMERIIFGSPADTAYMLPDALIAKGRGILRNAIRGTQGKQQERLRRLAIALESQFQHAETYRSYARSLNQRTDEAIADFKKRAEKLKAYWDKNDIDFINTAGRTPKDAVNAFLSVDFPNVKPAARKAIAGKGPKDELWMKELFAKGKVPAVVPNLFPLPEIWTFHLDEGDEGLRPEWLKMDFDDSKGGWNLVSSWNAVESQGYKNVDGYFCYRLKFKAPKFPAGKKVFLRIGSLDDSGDVYLNGVKVGSSPDPNDWDKSFEMDVTKEIKPGEENLLTVYGYDAGGGMGVWRPSALYTD